jgi:hypothetical protein
MSRRMQFFAIAIFFVVGLALGAFVLGNPLGLPFLPHAASGEAALAAAEPSVLYQCPMHPDVIEPNPANCPICGMPLVAMDTPADEATGIIEIDPVQVQNTGVVSVAARLGETNRTVRTVGILDFNADRITWINTKYQGWIEKVHVSYVGQQVGKGDALFEIYSPELVTTQEEYLRAIEYWDSLVGSERTEARRQALSLLRSSRDRLQYWDISDDQIRTLEQNKAVQRRLTVRSPVDGVVAEVMDESLEGMFVSAGMNLYRIADMETLWVHAPVPLSGGEPGDAHAQDLHRSAQLGRAPAGGYVLGRRDQGAADPRLGADSGLRRAALRGAQSGLHRSRRRQVRGARGEARRRGRRRGAGARGRDAGPGRGDPGPVHARFREPRAGSDRQAR